MDIQFKIRSYVALVEKMREAQRDYFAAAKARDTNKKIQCIRVSKALEAKVDAATAELQALLKTGFQPELFR